MDIRVTCLSGADGDRESTHGLDDSAAIELCVRTAVGFAGIRYREHNASFKVDAMVPAGRAPKGCSNFRRLVAMFRMASGISTAPLAANADNGTRCTICLGAPSTMIGVAPD